MKKKIDKKLGKKISKIILFFIFLESWFATQYFAHLMKYHKQLGGFQIGKFKLYFPFSYPFWLLKYEKLVQKTFNKVNNILYFISIAFVFLLVFYLKSKQKNTVHGSAEWADREDIIAMQLYNPNGVVLGCDPYNQILRDISDRHIFLAGPTRMGKGVNSSIPSALDYPYSVVFNDIKGELWNFTSGYRKHVLGQKVFMFCPVDTTGTSCSFNSLDFISIGKETEVEDVEVISQTLIDIDGKRESDHWIASAINLVIGAILHIKYSNPEASLPDVARFLMPIGVPFIDQIADILGMPREGEANELGVAARSGAVDILEDENGNAYLETDEFGEEVYSTKGYAAFNHLKYYGKDNPNLFREIYGYEGTKLDLDCKLHPRVAEEFMAFYKTPSRERGSVLTSATQKLRIFLDPLIAKHIKHSDFSIKQLMDEPCSLYLVTPPKSLIRTKPLLRLIITQIIYELTGRMINKTKKKKNFIEKMLNNTKENLEKFYNYLFPLSSEKKNRLLLLIDEFASLGKLDIFEQSMSFSAGWGIKCFLIAQSMQQLKKIYGKDNYILDNCSIQLHLTPNDEVTPKVISDMIGNYTEEIVSKSKKGFELTYTYNYSYVPRKLITPDEVRTLPYEEILLMVTGQNPIKGKKLFYYKDSRYEDKILPPLTVSDKNVLK